MINYYLYKLFNPDLNNLNNNKLLFHWKSNCNNENRIYSIESFFNKYPYFNVDYYKLNNPDINLSENIDLMVHWHLIGQKENRSCSEKNCVKDNINYEIYRLELNQDFSSITYVIISNNIEDINIKLEWINNFADDNWYIILILNGIKYENNIIDYFKIKIISIYTLPIEKYNLLKYYIINRINTDYYSFNDSFPDINKISLKEEYFTNIEKNNLIRYGINLKIPIIGIYISDNKIIPSNNFIIKCLSRINYHKMNIILFKDSDSNIDFNELLMNINYYILNNNEISNDKFINSCDYLITNNLEANINYSHLNKIFYPYFEQFYNLKNSIIVNDIISDEYYKNSILITEFDNYILDNNNKLYKTSSLSNNRLYVSYNNLDKYEYNFKIKNNDIKIIYTKYLDTKYGILKNKDEYYVKFYNKYYLTDLNYIYNNLPIKIDSIYIQEYNQSIYNIGYILNFRINIIFIINDKNINHYLNISYFLNDNYNNYNIIIYINNIELKNNYYDSIEDLSKQDLSKVKIFYNSDNKQKSDIDILLDLSNILEEYSLIMIIKDNYLIESNILLENINMLFICKRLFSTDFYNNILIFKRELLIVISQENKYSSLEEYLNNYNDMNDIYNINENNSLLQLDEENNLDYYISLYKNNYIDYNIYLEDILVDIKNNNLDIQYVSFINENTNINDWYNTINNIIENKDIQINIIEINSKKSEINFTKNINYFYLDSTSLSNSYKFNNAFAYNLVIKLFIKYTFEYKFIQFENYNSYIDKNIVYDIGCFDNIINFNNKIKLYNDINKSVDLKLLFRYLKERDTIDYRIWNKIKTIIINLDERTDRLYNVWEECNKIDLFNFERFSAIKINDFNQYKLIDNNKAWKKNNIEYLKSASGCKLSHLEILKKYKESDEEYLMILEDDVVFEINTLIYLNLALIDLKDIDWNILYLATNLKDKEDAVRVGYNILEIKSGLTTTAQIFKKSNIDNIIKLIEDSDIEIDNTYNLLNNKYCVYPMCVYQYDSYSDINKKNMDYGMFHKKFKYLF